MSLLDEQLHRKAINKRVAIICMELEELGIIKLEEKKDKTIQVSQTQMGKEVFRYMKSRGLTI